MYVCISPYMSWGVCNFLGSVSPQQKLEAMDGPSVTVHFYLGSKGKDILEV